MNKNKESEDWSKHKSLWEASGLSQRQYCLGTSLCPRKFNYHLKRLSKEQTVEPEFKFIDVSRRVQKNKPLNSERSLMRIELPNGVVINLELTPDRKLSEVINAVGVMPC